MSLRESLRGYEGDDSHALIDDDKNPVEGEVKPPTEGELEKHHAAPGRRALAALGVMYQGDWRILADGICKHVREQALALSTQLPVNLCAIGPGPLLDDEIDGEVTAAVGYLQNVHCSRYACAIRQMVIHSPEFLVNVVIPGGGRLSGPEDEERVWRSTIVYTSWERDRVADEIVKHLCRLGEVWVPCEANRRAFVGSGVPAERVRVIPYPYEPTTHPCSQIPVPRGNELVPSGRRFYTIGKWEPRKDQHQLLGAFLLAFKPTDRACLTIKTFGWGKWDRYPSPQKSGQYWREHPRVKANGWTPKQLARLVRVIDRKLTDQEIADLHAENNIYVSASHGEAWDIPAFDARSAGNSLVYVGYGGASEYTQPDGERFVEVPYEMGPVHTGYRWEEGAQWGQYRLEDLARALQRVRPPRWRSQPEDFAARYGRWAVGVKMRSAIDQVLRRNDPHLADQLQLVGTFG